MSEAQRAADITALMQSAPFRRFLFRAIQMAGVLEYSTPATNGSAGRDLAFAEGRRSLGFDLLREAEAALPPALRHPNSIMSLMSVLREEAQSSEQEKASGRRNDRYRDPGDDDGGDAER